MQFLKTVFKKICPICVLVSSTWIILLTLRYFGYRIDESLIAMLMGGSAVGISYVLANKFSLSGLASKFEAEIKKSVHARDIIVSNVEEIKIEKV